MRASSCRMRAPVVGVKGGLCPSKEPFMTTYLRLAAVGVALVVSLLVARPAGGAPFVFSTGDPDGKIATLSQPGTPGKLDTESADDFVVGSETLINHASFTGLLINGATTANVNH